MYLRSYSSLLFSLCLFLWAVGGIVWRLSCLKLGVKLLLPDTGLGWAGQERPKAKMTSKIEECCAGCWGVIWEYFISAIQQYHKGIPYFISFLLLEFKWYTPTYGYYQEIAFLQRSIDMQCLLCINAGYQCLGGSQRAVEKNLFLK